MASLVEIELFCHPIYQILDDFCFCVGLVVLNSVKAMGKKSKHKSINDMDEKLNPRFGIKKNSTATKNRLTGYTDTMDSTSLLH